MANTAKSAKATKIEDILKRYLGRYVEVYANGVDGYMSGILEEIIDGGWIIVVLGDVEYMYNIANLSLIKAVDRSEE